MKKENIRDNFYTEKKISRRGLLKRAGIITGIVMLSGVGIALHESFLSKTAEDLSLNDLERFESTLPEGPITLEQAQKYMPSVVELFLKNMPSAKSKQYITNDTVILQNNDPKLSGEAEFAQDNIYGINSDGKVFIFLDRINSDQNPPWQYDRLKALVYCNKSKPMVRFRQTLLQEIIGYHSLSTPVEKSIIESYQKAIQSYSGTDNIYQSGKQNGFSIKLVGEKSLGWKIENGLETLVTSYIATKISIDNKLAYSLTKGNLKPSDIVNFKTVLIQAAISDQELFIMHAKNELREFLLKVARGAKDIDLQNESQKLDFSVKLFLLNSSFIRWQTLKPFFPSIDTRDYQYLDRSQFRSFSDVPPGCLNH